MSLRKRNWVDGVCQTCGDVDIPEAVDIEALEMEDHEAQARRIVSLGSDDVKPLTREALHALELARQHRDLSGGEIDRLLATARAGLEDRERLDWLEARHDLTVTTDDTTPAGFSYLFPSTDSRVTLRAVIDAARGVRSTPSDERSRK